MGASDDLDKVLGPLEAEVMRTLWAGGQPMSVRAVLGQLNGARRQPLAYTTVMTVLARLADKDLLTRRLDGKGYLYEPAVRDAAEIAVRNVLRDFGDGAVAHFVDEAQGDPKLLRRLQRLLNQQR